MARIIAAALSCIAACAALPAAAQTLKERLPTCLACHGEDGQSHTPLIPSLGAQQTFYITVQLLMFRDRMRVSAPMNDLAKGLSDDDLGHAANIIAKLPAPQPAAGPRDEARLARARALAAQNHCNVCHQANYSGHDNVPRVAAQREDYLAETLGAYKNNARRGYEPTMAEVLAPISDEQIADLAYYLARFP
jgi:cytochrome c553